MPKDDSDPERLRENIVARKTLWTRISQEDMEQAGHCVEILLDENNLLDSSLHLHNRLPSNQNEEHGEKRRRAHLNLSGRLHQRSVVKRWLKLLKASINEVY